MTQPTHGMRPEEVEGLGRLMQQSAERLQQIAQLLDSSVSGVGWIGPDAARFKGQWWPQHRDRFRAAIADLSGFGQSALNNASEQGRASGTYGHGAEGGSVPVSSAAAGAAISVGVVGQTLRDWDHDLVTPLAKGADALEGLTGKVGFGVVGKAGDAFSAFSSGYEIAEDLATHQYVDAGLHTAFLGGDIAADYMKAGGPHGYLGGVTLQTWVEVGRAAQDVDWSPKGIQQVLTASRADWGAGLQYAFQEMPLKLVKIFSF